MTIRKAPVHMDLLTRSILVVTMTAGLCFGFLGLFFPAHNFERLHIFLFNLCSGGTVILIYTENTGGLSPRTWTFFIVSILCALSAFFGHYEFTVSAVAILAALTESIRVEKFSFFPWNFFTRGTDVSEKFHHASLLCLSLGLVMSALVTVNHEYLRLVSAPKLTLDIFFLGFSFPVSLVTMSVMFRMMRKSGKRWIQVLQHANFWIVNCGVIFFFLFILMEWYIAKLAIACMLSISVVSIFTLHARLGFVLQPKAFLTSGMFFLMMTAVTGIAYIPSHLFVPTPADGKIILRLHALVSLYGWNLSGLAVICRQNDFPIRLNSRLAIFLHWAVVCILAPAGFFLKPVPVFAVIGFALFLVVVFFAQGSQHSEPITGTGYGGPYRAENENEIRF